MCDFDLAKYPSGSILRVEFIGGKLGLVLVGVCDFPHGVGKNRAIDDSGKTWTLKDDGSVAASFSERGSAIKSIFGRCHLEESDCFSPGGLNLTGSPTGSFIRVKFGGRGNATIAVGQHGSCGERQDHVLIHDDGGFRPIANDGSSLVGGDCQITEVYGFVTFSSANKPDFADRLTTIEQKLADLKAAQGGADELYLLAHKLVHSITKQNEQLTEMLQVVGRCHRCSPSECMVPVVDRVTGEVKSAFKTTLSKSWDMPSLLSEIAVPLHRLGIRTKFTTNDATFYSIEFTQE